VKSHSYYFAYVDSGKRARLAAHHSEELFFLSDSFPGDWEHRDKDQELGKGDATLLGGVRQRS